MKTVARGGHYATYRVEFVKTVGSEPGRAENLFCCQRSVVSSDLRIVGSRLRNIVAATLAQAYTWSKVNNLTWCISISKAADSKFTSK